MALEDVTSMFDAPIPGESLVIELGSRPWQQAPEMATVDEAIEYYMERLSTDEFMNQLMDVLELEVPITSIVNTMQLNSVMEGVHSVDVGVLISPLLVEMIMYMADMAKVDYVSGLEKPDTSDKLSPTKIAKMMTKFKEEVDEMDVDEEPSVEALEEETEEPKGLMARRT
jgi:hypothetical protein